MERIIAKLRKSDILYPKYQFYQVPGGLINHVQTSFGDGGELRPAILVRHVDRGHLCGYVLVAPEEWAAHETEIRRYAAPRIDFAAGSNKFCTWCEPNSKGDLRNPIALTGDDFWVGFNLMTRPDLSIEEALAILAGFENIIYRVRNGHLTAGR